MNRPPYPRRLAGAARSRRLRSAPPEALAQFCERLFATLQLEELVHRHGHLIRMQVHLRTRIPFSACAEIADAFRKAGFVVESTEGVGLIVTGEACLALTFMIRAADAGILSEAFEVRLHEILDDDTQVRVERHEGVLRALDPMFGSIASVDLPRRATG